MKTLLIIGNDIVPIAVSAYQAGYEVYSVDFFGDSDLQQVCVKSKSIIQQRPGQCCGEFIQDFDVNLLLSYFEEFISKYPIDGVILGSGLEDFPEILEPIAEQNLLIGNTPEHISRVRKTPDFFRTLKRLHITHPATDTAHNYEDAKRIGKDLGYPLILKPAQRFGGMGIQNIEDQESLQKAFLQHKTKKEVIIQEFIEGISASVSTLSTISKVEVISVNEQLIGLPQLGVTEPYGFCGSIVPLDAPRRVINTATTYAEKICAHFQLVGSNGIDFIATKSSECAIIEVNPRMQGTLECLERVYDTNLVAAHINACTRQELSRATWKPHRYCTRIILYAFETTTIPSLHQFHGIRDIPFEGTIIKKGEPLCSLLAVGSKRNHTLNSCFTQATHLSEYIAQTQGKHMLQKEKNA
jgi:predicted ATP-grasp superfamily ATP-dependent carboligase